jgi:hypothetical protein
VFVTGRIVVLLNAPPWADWPPSPVHKFLIPVVGTTTIVLVGIVATTAARPPRANEGD